MSAAEPMSDLRTLKQGLRETWTTGDYGRVTSHLRQSSESFVLRFPVSAGMRVLDVACGTGQAAIPLARAGAEVTGVDIAPGWLAQAREQAAAENLPARFDEGDAEDLPYADASFDLVVSLIGAMFAPRPERVAAELTRVCRPGGRIVMANWTPGGFVGRFFATLGRHAPSPPGMPTPLAWGEPETVRERLREGIATLHTAPCSFTFRYPFGPAEVAQHYRRHFGPVVRAFAALDAAGQERLRADLEALWAGASTAGDGGTVVEAEVLEVVAVRA